MNNLWIFNDLHVGVQRSGGTTESSAAALRRYGHRKHSELLELATDGDVVVINGDLSDIFNIELSEAIELYIVAATWLQSRPKGKLVWALGNHDLSKDSAKLGTVAFIGHLLAGQFPDRFQLIKVPTRISKDVYVLPHVANQETFDLEVSRIPDDVKLVLLHCNYDNTFACQADHSLNLSREQAKSLVKADKFVVLGHEHQGRTLMNDKVIITGNQFPTSVSDCLAHGDAQADGCKYTLRVNLSDIADMELVPTWSPKDPEGGYREIDWRRLADAPANLGFIRVVGKATSDEAAEVIKAISTLRQAHKAFVITNAVKVDSVDGVEELEASIEEIKSVSVIDLLLGMLDEDQQAVVKTLMKEQE